MKDKIIKFLRFLPDSSFIFLAFVARLKYVPNFNSPKSLNEKINYIKLSRELYDLRCLVSDRIRVREYVAERSNGCKLIPVIWTGKLLGRDLWDLLPQKFVIKANHGSGMVKVVNKDLDSYEDVINLCYEWLEIDYSSIGREWFYAGLEKYLIVEEFLNLENEVPPDYKFFCMNGVVRLVQLDLDRFEDHTRNLYDRSFNKISGSLYYPQGSDVKKPKTFEKAVVVAEELSKDFSFIRVDLYLVNDDIYFGELTNAPGNGLEPFKPRHLDFDLGRMLNLMH